MVTPSKGFCLEYNTGSVRREPYRFAGLTWYVIFTINLQGFVFRKIKIERRHCPEYYYGDLYFGELFCENDSEKDIEIIGTVTLDGIAKNKTTKVRFLNINLKIF